MPKSKLNEVILVRVGPIYRLANIVGRYQYQYIDIGKLGIGIGHIDIGYLTIGYICIGQILAKIHGYRPKYWHSRYVGASNKYRQKCREYISISIS